MRYGRQIVLSLTVAALMILNGCATNPLPAVRVQIQRVEVPIPVTCVKGELPPRPAKVGKLSGNAEADIGPIAAALVRALAYSEELRAMLVACKD